MSAPPPATRPPDPPPVESTPPTAPAFTPLTFDATQRARIEAVQRYVAQAAKTYDVDPTLVNGVIWVESKFEVRAKGPAGAQGLMQLMPKTARAMAQRVKRKSRPYNPEFSVHAGTYLLSILLKKFDGDQTLALFAYARGSGRVRAWQKQPGQPIPLGVQKFIHKVRRAQATFAALGLPKK